MKAGWTAGPASTVAIRWPNVPWKQPDSGEWISFKLIPGDGEQKSLGSSKLERQFGLVMVQVFVPKNKGTRRAYVLGDAVGAIFRYQTVARDGVSVEFLTPELADVSERADTYQTNVKVPYRADKLFS